MEELIFHDDMQTLYKDVDEHVRFAKGLLTQADTKLLNLYGALWLPRP